MEFPSDEVIRELENREYSVEKYFSKAELAKLSKVELLRYKNMRKNYEIMLAVGLPAVMPEFMKGPRSRAKRKPKKVESDSDEEWMPYKSTREKKQTIRFPIPEEEQKENRPRKLKTWKNTKEMKKTESHTYPLRVQERLNYMDVEVPDDDDFIYCEECNQEHEEDCPIHGPLLVVTDTEQSQGIPERSKKTLPPGLKVRESDITNAGLGVFAEMFFPKRTRFGPYEGEITENQDEAHETGYAWQVDNQVKGNFLNIFCRSNVLQSSIVHRKNTVISDTIIKVNSQNKTCNCDICMTQTVLNKREHLHRHNITQTVNESHQSDVCRKGSLEKHKEVHTGDKPYKCDVCGKAFSHLQNLKSHMRTHTGDKPYKCDVCGKAFSHSQNLKSHMRTHTGEKPYKCDVCGKAFNMSHHLQSHMRTHTGDKPYRCDVCGNAFNDPSNFQKHMKTHTGEKPYKCEVCEKAFTQSSTLHAHMRTHTGDKPYTCDVCGKAFNAPGNFQRHMKTHTGDKSSKCEVCEKTFIPKQHLKRHMRTHTGDKPYNCDVCGMAFTLSSSLHAHMRAHTGDKPYKCDMCGKAFNHSQNLQTHMKTHTGDKPY